MRISIDPQRGSHPFGLLESLEPRTLLSAYALADSISFPASGRGGASPQGLVMAPNGDLYGTNISGGRHYGTVFKITGTEHTVTTLAVFNGKNGIEPRGGLVFDNAGDLFGTAVGGGTKALGVVWEITAASLASTASTITPVISFHGTDGSFPISGLYSDGAGGFVGYTVGAGASKSQRALVFRITPSGTSATMTAVAPFTHGEKPTGGLTVDSAGNIFGETRNGGTHHRGSVFEIPNGSASIMTLVSFTGPDGATPDGDLVVANDGTIYGTTLVGGALGAGTIFKIDTSGSAPALTTLAGFKGSNGTRPIGSLILDNAGNLFGVAASGGGGGGVLFEWSPTGTTSTLTSLFNFRTLATGRTPTGPLIMNSSGQFFGTTFTGGRGNLGTVFELVPNVT